MELNNLECVGWEEVPDEDLWEDGELDENGGTLKLFKGVLSGEFVVMRRKTNEML